MEQKRQPAGNQRLGLMTGRGLRQTVIATVLVVAGLVTARLALAWMDRPDMSMQMLVVFAAGALLCLSGGLMALASVLRRPGRRIAPVPSGNWLVLYVMLIATLLPLLWLGFSGLISSQVMGRLGNTLQPGSQLVVLLGEWPQRWASSGALLQTVCLSTLAYLYLWRGRRLPEGLVRLRGFRLWSILGGGLAGLGLWLGAVFIQRLVLTVLPASWPTTFPPLEVSHAPAPWLATLITLVAAPLAEEAFFRGYVFPTWREGWGPAWGMAASAALYGLYTLNPITFLSYFVVGLGLAALTQLSGRLAPAWAAHLVFNLLAFLITWPA